MTTLILTVTALLALAAIQCAGASDTRIAARQPAKYAELRTSQMNHSYPARLASTTAVRTHVARLP